MSPMIHIYVSVALIVFLVSCGKKQPPKPVELAPDPCAGGSCNSFPVQTPAPTVTSECVVVVSPSPSRAGEQVTVNVFTSAWQSLSLMGWATSTEANPRWGRLYNHTTGTMIYPHPGNFAVQATAQDAAGNVMSCAGMQAVN